MDVGEYKRLSLSQVVRVAGRDTNKLSGDAFKQKSTLHQPVSECAKTVWAQWSMFTPQHTDLQRGHKLLRELIAPSFFVSLAKSNNWSMKLSSDGSLTLKAYAMSVCSSSAPIVLSSSSQRSVREITPFYYEPLTYHLNSIKPIKISSFSFGNGNVWNQLTFSTAIDVYDKEEEEKRSCEPMLFMNISAIHGLNVSHLITCMMDYVYISKKFH